MKKLISLFVIVTMVVACMTFTANAAEVSVASIADFITDGQTVNKLTADINAGETPLQLMDGNGLIVDLNGHTWTTGNVVVDVIGGSCIAKIYDSSAAKTGAIISTNNDAISISNGELSIENITVRGGNDGMDAVFVNGGKVTIKNCTLSAGKAGIDAANGSEAGGAFADITVIGGKFANYSNPGDRCCAIEVRQSGAKGPKVSLTGNITFENNKIMIRNDYTKAIGDGVVAGADATVSFGELGAVAGRDNYKTCTITYAYTGTGETPDAPETPDTSRRPPEVLPLNVILP